MTDLRLDTITATGYDEDGFLGIQSEADGAEEASAPMAHAHHPFGFFGRPLDPDVDEQGTISKGAVALRWDDGDEEHALALEDPRDASKIPEHSKGSAGVYNSAGMYILLDKEARTITILVPQDDDTQHKIRVGKVSGQPSILIEEASGPTIEIANKVVTIKADTINVQADQVNLGPTPGSQVACVGDLVQVAIGPLANAGGPVLGPAMTLTGQIVAIGQIISGRESTLA